MPLRFWKQQRTCLIYASKSFHALHHYFFQNPLRSTLVDLIYHTPTQILRNGEIYRQLRLQVAHSNLHMVTMLYFIYENRLFTIYRSWSIQTFPRRVNASWHSSLVKSRGLYLSQVWIGPYRLIIYDYTTGKIWNFSSVAIWIWICKFFLVLPEQKPVFKSTGVT